MDTLAYKVAHDRMVEELDKISKEVLDTFHGNPDFEWNVVIGYSSGVVLALDFASTKSKLNNIEKDLAAACYKNVEERLKNIFSEFEKQSEFLIWNLVYLYVGADGSRRIDFQPIPRTIQAQN